MLTTIAIIKTFMDDMTESILEYEDFYLQKVFYSNTLTLLYRSTNKPSLTEVNLELIGVYSNINKNFICLILNYYTKKLFLNDNEELKKYTKGSLEIELNQIIKFELLNILSLQVKPNKIVKQDIRKQAEIYFKTGKIPSFSFDEYKKELNFDNLESFIIDKQDYAYDCAENFILNNSKLIEEYQNYEDLKYALSEIQNDTPIELALHADIDNLVNNKNYKTYNLVLTKDGINEVNINGVAINSLKNYPYYSIKKVFWGKKLLFSLDDYDINKVNELKNNENYNIQALINCNFYDRNDFLTYVNPSMFKSFEFCNAIVEYSSSNYNLIDISYKENISFIQKHIQNLNLSTIIENVSESFILKNETFFLNCIKDKMEYVYCSFPKKIQEKENFLLKLIKVDGGYALSIISEQKANDSVIQKAFDEWFLKNPNSIRNHNYYSDNDNSGINKLKNKTTILNAMNIQNMKDVDINLLNDLSFMKQFLNKIKQTNNLIENFSLFYNNLDLLKTNFDFILEAIKLFKLSEYDFDMLENMIKDNDEIQRTVVLNNEKILYKMKDSIKEEFIYSDTQKYLSYYNKKIGNNFKNNIDSTLFEKIVKSSLTKPENIVGLEHMSYSQKLDEMLAKKLIKINPKAYKYFSDDILNNETIAKILLKQKISIIPFLPAKTKWNNKKSLFNNKEIMKECLAINPLDFSEIPEESRTTGPAPLLKDKDFIIYVMKLDPYNARFLSMKSPFREDFDVARETLLLDAEQVTEFAKKIFRDETFVNSLLSETLKKYQNTTMYDDKIKEVNEYIMPEITKKIKNSKDFIAKFPMFKE